IQPCERAKAIPRFLLRCSFGSKSEPQNGLMQTRQVPVFLGGGGPMALAFPAQQREQFFSPRDLKFGSRAGGRKTPAHTIRGIEQLQLNPMVAAPKTQESKHAQTAPFQSFQIGKIEENNAGVGLMSDCIA